MDSDDWLLQRYVHPPMLLAGGRKFSLRMYVIVVCTLSKSETSAQPGVTA